MPLIWKFFFILQIVCFLSSPGRATELYENYVSARAAGMGNAYASIVADKDAVFYNPAALTKVGGFNITIVDPMLATDAQDIYSVVNTMRSYTSTTQLSQYFGRQIYLGFFGSTGVWLNGFAAVGYDSLQVSMDLRNPAYPSSRISATNDIGLAGGLGFSLIPNVLSMGFVGKRVTRYGTRTTLGAGTFTNLSNTSLQQLFLSQGVGYGLDMGITLSAPTPVKPSLSFVWKDMGQTRFTAINNQYGTPPEIDNEIMAGFGMEIDALVLKIRPALDYKHANLWEEQLGKKIHVGTEFAFPLFSVRGGFYQGYYTYGASLDMWWLRLDAASYGVEMDTYPGQREDRRYTAQLTIQINLDPDFKFLKGGQGGGAFRPKPRR